MQRCHTCHTYKECSHMCSPRAIVPVGSMPTEVPTHIPTDCTCVHRDLSHADTLHEHRSAETLKPTSTRKTQTCAHGCTLVHTPTDNCSWLPGPGASKSPTRTVSHRSQRSRGAHMLGFGVSSGEGVPSSEAHTGSPQARRQPGLQASRPSPVLSAASAATAPASRGTTAAAGRT